MISLRALLLEDSSSGVFSTRSPSGAVFNGSPSGVVLIDSTSGAVSTCSPSGAVSTGSPSGIVSTGSRSGSVSQVLPRTAFVSLVTLQCLTKNNNQLGTLRFSNFSHYPSRAFRYAYVSTANPLSSLKSRILVHDIYHVNLGDCVTVVCSG